MTALPLRPLDPADARAAAAIIRIAFATQPLQTDPPSSALRETADSLAPRLIPPGGGAGAVARDGSLAAVVLWGEEEGRLYVGRLAVLPAWRRRGLAQALLRAAAAEATRRAIAVLRVRVRIPLTDNRRMFRALGFVEGALEHHHGHADPTTVVMECELARLGG